MQANVYIDPIAALLGAWSTQLSPATVVFRLLVSLLFAGVIGCERATRRHSAGLRTFILVSVTATVVALSDLFAGGLFGGQGTLLSAAALIGVAIFSGNSLLYSSRNQIKGLTTAAALWACGFLGAAIGGGFYTAAVTGFAIILCTLVLLPAVETALQDNSNHFELHLELKNKGDLQDFITTIRKLGLRIDDIEFNPAYLNSGLSVYTISVTITGTELKKYKKHREIVEALATLDYVGHIEELI